MRRHTRVFPLRSGREAFPVMLAAIAKARVSVLLEMYIWNDDGTGLALAYAFLAAADRGVKVRLLVDDMDAINRDVADAVAGR